MMERHDHEKFETKKTMLSIVILNEEPENKCFIYCNQSLIQTNQEPKRAIKYV